VDLMCVYDVQFCSKKIDPILRGILRMLRGPSMWFDA
jgi:hypothetical protein